MLRLQPEKCERRPAKDRGGGTIVLWHDKEKLGQV